MKKKIAIWIGVPLIIGVAFTLSMYIYMKIAQHQAKVLFEEVKNHDKLYVYETYYKALNAAFYVEDPKDTADLINYYSKVANHDASAYFNFEIKTMPISMHEPIYVYKYCNKGSKVVQLIDFDVNCWGYIKGYVYIPTTHIHAPSDSLVRAKEAFISEYNKREQVKKMNRIAKEISEYGWYCDN